MALEDLTGSNKFIDALVPANPANADDVREGAAHIRGVKNVLVNSFPNVNGQVLASEETLNNVAVLGTAVTFQQVTATKDASVNFAQLSYMATDPAQALLRVYRGGVADWGWYIDAAGNYTLTLSGDAAQWSHRVGTNGVMYARGGGYQTAQLGRTNTAHTSANGTIDVGQAPGMARGTNATPAGGTLLVPFGHNLNNPVVTITCLATNVPCIAIIEALDATQFAVRTLVWDGASWVVAAVQFHWQAISGTVAPA